MLKPHHLDKIMHYLRPFAFENIALIRVYILKSSEQELVFPHPL
jgi:hypothetical protein